MGSSKKHKEKHKKRRRERSRSGSRDKFDKYDDDQRRRPRSRSPLRRDNDRDPSRYDYEEDRRREARRLEDSRDLDDKRRDRDYQDEVERQRLAGQQRERRIEASRNVAEGGIICYFRSSAMMKHFCKLAYLTQKADKHEHKQKRPSVQELHYNDNMVNFFETQFSRHKAPQVSCLIHF